MTFFFRPLFIALATLAAFSASLAGAQAGVFNPETFTLPNGLQVVVVPNHRVPVVTHMMWYKVGSADEPQGKSGIAHFFEHLMFKGTEKYPDGEFSRIVARNGGQENAFTSYDYTGYYQTVAKDRLELVMGLEADRMRGLTLTAQQIEPERKVILEERSQRTDNNPSALLREHINAALYMNHPFRRPVIGWRHEVEALSLDDLRTFYRRWYAPNNAILVVGGDITAAELKPLAEKTYGQIDRIDVPSRIRATEPPHQASRRVVLRDARVRQASWSRRYLAPSYTEGDRSQAYALQVAAELLGGGSTSTLYKALVIEQKLAVSAGAYYNPEALGPGTFVVYASPQPGVDMATLETAVEAVVQKFVKSGLDDAGVKKSIRRLTDEAIFARDSLTQGARTIGAALTIGMSVDDVEAWPDRIAKVTASGARAALKTVLEERRSVTGLLLANGEH